MKENPFDQVVAAALRSAAEKAAARKAAEEQAAREHQRLVAIAQDRLAGVVIPLLEAARESMQGLNVLAETGNGTDPATGHPRRVLRVITPHRAHSPALIFEAAITAAVPALIYRTELATPQPSGTGERLPDPTRENVTAIVSAFITQSIDH